MFPHRAFIVVCKSYKEIPLVKVSLAAKTLFAVMQIIQLALYALGDIHFGNLFFSKQRAQAIVNIIGHMLLHFPVAQALVIRLHK